MNRRDNSKPGHLDLSTMGKPAFNNALDDSLIFRAKVEKIYQSWLFQPCSQILDRTRFLRRGFFESGSPYLRRRGCADEFDEGE